MMVDVNPVIAVTVEECFRAIGPPPLASEPGGPVGRRADLVMAEMVGHDGNIEERLEMPSPLRAEWYVPLRATRRSMLAWDEAADGVEDGPRRATYDLQGTVAETAIAATAVAMNGDMPTGWRPNPRHEATILCVRYRRRMPTI